MNTHRLPFGFKALVVLFVCFFGILTGCAARYRPTSPPMPTFGKPELLFLKAEPCRRLVVEIAAVEGTQPDPVAVQTLRRFLTKYCDKPDGIEIVRDAPIPRREARGVSPWILALAHMKGPAETPSKSRPAYLYVFFYDSRIADAATRSMDLPSYISSNYPCGIFVDVSYWGPSYRTFIPRVLCHEASHVLGLTKSTAHGDGAHCKNRQCLVYPRHSAEMAFKSRAYNYSFDICDDCKADLRAAKAGPHDRRFSFQGPALVRTERNYRVVLLPDVVYCDLAPFQPFDWRFIAARAEKSWRRNGKEFLDRYLTYRSQMPAEQMNSYQRGILRAMRDPDPGVVQLAREILRQSEARNRRFSPRRQAFTGEASGARPQ